MILLNLFYILIPLTIILAFTWAPKAEILGDASRLLYFHVPVAWLSALAFILSGIYAILFLRGEKKNAGLLEEKAYNSAVIGITFLILTVIVGSIWSKVSWGAYWNWDPRQTSIVVLLLIYIAYFSLRAAIGNNPNRGKLTSSYLIIAMVATPFLVFIIPRLYVSLHPDPILNPEVKIHLHMKMKITLLLSLISFTLLFVYLFNLANRISKIKLKIQEKSEGNYNDV